MNDLIWASFLPLSNHTQGDEYATEHFWYLPEHPYQPENSVDIATWDETVRFLAERRFNMVVIEVGDGVRYSSHPEISAPDAWSKELLREKLQVMRKLGLEPIPKLDFSATGSTWMKIYSRMVSSSVYYQVCADLIKEVFDLFDGPRFFHLGLGDETADLPINQAVSYIRTGGLYWHDASYLFSICEKLGTRPWMWADRFWKQPEQFAENIPRSVVLSNRYYETFRDLPASDGRYPAMHAGQALDRLGYTQILTTSSCCFHLNPDNPYQTVCYGSQLLEPARLLGYMSVPCVPITEEREYQLKNDIHILYLARCQVYGDP